MSRIFSAIETMFITWISSVVADQLCKMFVMPKCRSQRPRRTTKNHDVFLAPSDRCALLCDLRDPAFIALHRGSVVSESKT